MPQKETCLVQLIANQRRVQVEEGEECTRAQKKASDHQKKKNKKGRMRKRNYSMRKIPPTEATVTLAVRDQSRSTMSKQLGIGLEIKEQKMIHVYRSELSARANFNVQS